MAGDTSEEVDDLDRRNFLKAVGAGVSLSAIDLLSKDEAQIGDITYDPEEEVPYVAGWRNDFNEDGSVEKEPIYQSLEKEAWDHMKATTNAVKNLQKAIESLENLNEDDLAIKESHDPESPTNRRLDIMIPEKYQEDLDSLRDELPTSSSGVGEITESPFEIPVGVDEIHLEEQSACYDEDYTQFNDVPGGAPINSDNAKGATAGAYVHDSYGLGWITACHLADDSGNAIGKIVNLLENDSSPTNNTIGEIKDSIYQDSPSKIDAAYIQRTVADRDPHPWVANDDYTDNEGHPIKGVVSDEELSARTVDPTWNITIQGPKSCQDTSSGYSLVRNGSGSTNVVGIILDGKYTQDGDSGGPYFHLDNGDAFICGEHVGEEKSSNSSYGNTAETIENQLNGNWLTQ